MKSSDRTSRTSDKGSVRGSSSSDSDQICFFLLANAVHTTKSLDITKEKIVSWQILKLLNQTYMQEFHHGSLRFVSPVNIQQNK